jgi:hypothetical protein
MRTMNGIEFRKQKLSTNACSSLGYYCRTNFGQPIRSQGKEDRLTKYVSYAKHNRRQRSTSWPTAPSPELFSCSFKTRPAPTSPNYNQTITAGSRTGGPTSCKQVQITPWINYRSSSTRLWNLWKERCKRLCDNKSLTGSQLQSIIRPDVTQYNTA